MTSMCVAYWRRRLRHATGPLSTLYSVRTLPGRPAILLILLLSLLPVEYYCLVCVGGSRVGSMITHHQNPPITNNFALVTRVRLYRVYTAKPFDIDKTCCFSMAHSAKFEQEECNQPESIDSLNRYQIIQL